MLAPTSKPLTYSPTKQSYLLPLILVTSLFFLWGIAYGLLDVLNKHFQETLNINKQRSTLLQAAYFGAYFLVAVPAGMLMTKVGYRNGIIAGLLLYAVGALLFYPAAENASFNLFLLALFVLASGLTFLETAANPYITVLGDPATSAFRLNLAQSFNGVGSFLGPLLGGALFFGEQAGAITNNLESVKMVYIIIAAIVLLVAVFFFRTPMPEVKEEEQTSAENVRAATTSLLHHRHFVWAVVAQFFYVAAQVGIAALFINYCTEKNVGINSERAAYLLSGSLVLFTIGRFAGTALLKVIAAPRLLALFAFAALVLSVVVVFVPGIIGVYALMAVFFFMSIMFPTIFALGVKNLGSATKKGASFIIMAIVGGALMPYIMGYLAEAYSTPFSYIVPLLCFVVVLVFGLTGYKTKAQ